MGSQRIRQNRMTEHQQPWSFTICQTEIPTVFARLCACSVAHSCPTLCSPVDCSTQDPLSMEFFRQEYWNGLPFPPPGDLPHPGIEPRSPAFPALAGGFFSAEPPGKQVSTSLGYPKVLNLESGTQVILTGDVNIQSYHYCLYDNAMAMLTKEKE